MVIGNGLIANAFKTIDSPEFIYFASGVSNSNNIDPKEFLREENALIEAINTNKTKILVYFSTCSLYDSSMAQREYNRHKIAMENKVISLSPKYYIFRLSNIVGQGGNQKTLLNFFIDKVQNNQEISLWRKAERNLLGVDDLVEITNSICLKLPFNNTYNVANLFNYSVEQIIDGVENFLGKSTSKIFEEKGEPLMIDLSLTQKIISETIQDKTPEEYLDFLLKRYYTNLEFSKV